MTLLRLYHRTAKVGIGPAYNFSLILLTSSIMQFSVNKNMAGRDARYSVSFNMNLRRRPTKRVRKLNVDFNICAYRYCRNNEINSPALNFFQFPTNALLAKQWSHNAGCHPFPPKMHNNMPAYVLCSEHFKDWCFKPGSNRTVLETKLSPIPTVFKNPIPKEEIYPDHTKMPRPTVKVNLPHDDSAKSNQISGESDHEVTESSHALADSEHESVHELTESEHELTESEHDKAEGGPGVPEADPLQIDTVVGQQTLTDVDVIVDKTVFGNLKYTDNIYEDFARNLPSSLSDRVTHKTYCRLCARVVSVASLISVFTDADSDKYRELLQTCLPGVVTEDDGLPHNACRPCLTKLEYCSAALQQFAKAEQKLKLLHNYAINRDSNETVSNIMQVASKRSLLPLSDSLVGEVLNKTLKLQGTEPAIMVLKHAAPVARSPDIKYECSLSFDKKKDLLDHSLIVHPISNRNQLIFKTFQSKRGENSVESNEIPKTISKNIQQREPFKYKCITCFKIFDIRSEMLNHVLTEHATLNKQSKILCKILKNGERETSKENVSDASKIEYKTEITDQVLEAKQPNNVKYECLICGSLHDKKHTLARHAMDLHRTLSKNRLLYRVIPTTTSQRRVITCLRCISKFTDLRSYRKHMQSHITFKCETCAMKFDRIFKLKHHRKVHKNEMNKKCEECNIEYTTKTEMIKHRRVMHKKMRTNNEGNGEVSDSNSDLSCLCNVCGKLFPNKNYLKRHIVIHGDERLHDCKICSKSFKLKSTLTRHVQTHTKALDFICQTCGKQFRTIVGLKQHMLIHSTNKPHMCDECGMQYLRRIDLAKHKLRHDKPNLKRQVTCRICHKTYPTRSSLNYHMSQHGEKMYKCEECDKQLGSKVQYIVHMRVHSGETPYPCNTCSKSFRSKPLLRQHQAIHQKTHQHHCDMCDKNFKSLRSLYVHKNIHTDKKKHQCSDCGKKFTHRGDLVKHELIHRKHLPILKDGTYYFVNDSKIVEETVWDTMTDVEIATQSIQSLSKDMPDIQIPEDFTLKKSVAAHAEPNAQFTNGNNSILKSLLE